LEKSGSIKDPWIIFKRLKMVFSKTVTKKAQKYIKHCFKNSVLRHYRCVLLFQDFFTGVYTVLPIPKRKHPKVLARSESKSKGFKSGIV
jgi:hypothetical protein